MVQHQLIESELCVGTGQLVELVGAGDVRFVGHEEEDPAQGGRVAAGVGAGGVKERELAPDGTEDRLGRVGLAGRGSDRDPVTAVVDGEAHALDVAGGDGEGDRLLDAARCAGRIVRRVVVRGQGRAGAMGALEDGGEDPKEALEAGEAFSGCPGVLAQCGRVMTLTARTEAEFETAFADVVEGQCVPGEGHRMAEVGRGDECAETDPSCDGGGGREDGDGGVPGAVGHAAPADVVVRPRGREPDVVCPLPLAAGFGPTVGGKDDEADPHEGRRYYGCGT